MSGVTFRGHENFQRRLKQIENPPAAAKDDVGKVAVSGLEENYSGNPLGWKPLKPETIKRKGHARILFERGDLMHAYGFTLQPYGLQLFNDDRKAMIHQRTRPHLKLRPEVRQEMLDALVRGMLK